MTGNITSCVTLRGLAANGLRLIHHGLKFQRTHFCDVDKRSFFMPSPLQTACVKDPSLSTTLTNCLHSHSTPIGFSRGITKDGYTVTRAPVRNMALVHSAASQCVLCVPRRTLTEDRKTTALTVWSDLVQIKSSPLPALVLGLSGLVPFVSAPLFMIVSQAYLPTLAFAQTAYGAAILSFLGGVRWGITLPEESVNKPDWKNLTYSVVPSLIAWAGLLCAEPVSTIAVMTGLAGLAYFDTMMYGYPPWFKALRFLLSIFAVLSLWTTFVCRYLLGTKRHAELAETEKLP